MRANDKTSFNSRANNFEMQIHKAKTVSPTFYLNFLRTANVTEQ